jgi:hypothetical protein
MYKLTPLGYALMMTSIQNGSICPLNAWAREKLQEFVLESLKGRTRRKPPLETQYPVDPV